MKKIFLTLALVTGMIASAQVRIGGTGTAVDANAILELQSTTKGLLFPKVALTSTTAFAPLSAHTAGMTVYNTATAGDVTPGLYVNSGTAWVSLGGSSSAAFSSATYTKTSAYTSLNTAEVTPNNITTIVFGTGNPGTFTITDLPAGPSNVGKVLNIYSSGNGVNYFLNFNRGGDGVSLTNQSAQNGRGYSFVWDGIGWAKTSY
jgi:hypothetical protein